MPSNPLVSAIMPTRGRPVFAAEAIRRFGRQTYSPRELVIVDDHDCRSVSDQLDLAPGIRYLWRMERETIGAKRNYACTAARGQIIIHWDDDDLSAPTRIEDQVRRLIESCAAVTGYNRVIFVDGAKRWRYLNPNTGYAVGSSLCYWKRTWEARGFPEHKNVGEDNAFVLNRKVVAVDAGEQLICRIHEGQTNTTTAEERAGNPRQWRAL